MPSYIFEIDGARAADALDPYVREFPAYLAQVAKFWPELATCQLAYAPPTGPTASAVPVYMLDYVTDSEALAFHTRTILGAVSCVVERPQCVKYGLPFGPELIHEVIEAGLNPQLDKTAWAWLTGYSSAQKVLYEVCDPVAYAGTVNVGGIEFPNVTTPAYWAGLTQGPYDLAGVVDKPLPSIPKSGALMIQGGALVYGPAPLPKTDMNAREMREYLLAKARYYKLQEHLATKRGRRWAHGRLL